jgi:hypothetical protein
MVCFYPVSSYAYHFLPTPLMSIIPGCLWTGNPVGCRAFFRGINTYAVFYKRKAWEQTVETFYGVDAMYIITETKRMIVDRYNLGKQNASNFR